jgi:hypothetical protein
MVIDRGGSKATRTHTSLHLVGRADFGWWHWQLGVWTSRHNPGCRFSRSSADPCSVHGMVVLGMEHHGKTRLIPPCGRPKRTPLFQLGSNTISWHNKIVW